MKRSVSILVMFGILLFNSNYLNAKSNPVGKDPPDPPKPLVFNLLQSTFFTIDGQAFVHFSIIVERDPSNRGLTFYWDCPTSGGSSYRALDGEKARRIFDNSSIVRNLYLTEGLCIIVVTLHRSAGKDIKIIKEVNVVGSRY